MKIDKFKNKAKLTNIDKYGVPYIMQNKYFIEKSKLTCLIKYGVEHVLLNNNILRLARSKYFYDKQYFASKPEIAYYILLKDNNIKFEYQPSQVFNYEYKEEIHFYIPDFKVKNEFIELKGNLFFKEDGTMQNPFDHSMDGLYEAKHLCMLKNNVKILTYSDYKQYIEYVNNKYGTQYLNKFKCAK